MQESLICSEISNYGLPSSHARVFDNFVFTMGVMPVNVGSSIPPVGFKAQAELVMENLQLILDRAGTTPDRIFKLTLLLKDIRSTAGFYEIWARYFPGVYPAVTLYEIPKSAGDFELQLDVIALSGESDYEITPIQTANAPRMRGMFPQGVKVGDYIITSGMYPIDPLTNKPVDDFKEQVRLCIRNAIAVVEAGGGTKASIVKNCLPLENIKLFDTFNKVYTEFFQAGPNAPARSCFGVNALEGMAQVYCETYAYVGDDREELISPLCPNLGYPFCHGMRAGELLILSGQIGYKSSIKATPEGFADQTRVVIENMLSCVEVAGGEPQNLVRCHNYLTNIGQLELFNEVFEEFFDYDFPACSTYQVNGLAHRFIVEITGIGILER